MAADTRSNRVAVQATNDDASASKLSCVKKGYMKDDYIHLFVKRPVRRSPIINRGYFARYAAFRKLLYEFLDCVKNMDGKSNKKQILSLGAGFDTTFFQLQDEGKAPYLYVELDFKEVTRKKAALIENSVQLRSKVGEATSISHDMIFVALLLLCEGHLHWLHKISTFLCDKRFKACDLFWCCH
ncbi:Leucine carboxyl methyltransferase 1 [Orobanche gracilis]